MTIWFPIILKIYNEVFFFFANIIWRFKNPRNFTTIRTKSFRNIKVGNNSYGEINIFQQYKIEDEGLEIGSYCSIAPDVKFILGGEHDYCKFSTYPFQNKLKSKGINEAKTKGKIIIQDDVWIGQGAVILSGVTIGQGSVVGAYSLVTKNIDPYTIAGGNPVKVIKRRFKEELIESLLKLKFEEIDLDKILECKQELLSSNLDLSVLVEISKWRKSK